MIAGRQSIAQQRRPSALVRDTRQANVSSATRRHRADYWLIVVCSLLLTIGLIVIYSISPGLAVIKNVGDNYYVSKQLVAIGLGLLTFLAAAYVPLGVWRKIWKPLVGLAALSSLLVFIMPADELFRAHRWLTFGGFSFQVAELIKFALLIGVAHFLVLRWRQEKLDDTRQTLYPLLAVMAILGLVVAKFQSDLGSAAVMVGMICVMAFIVGVPLKKVGLIVGIIAFGAIVAIGTSDYRRDRLYTYLHPESDCQTAGYQACQALIAVGSGGIVGLGLGHSVQAYGYLPEASNDSIFAIMAEKFGFIGVVVILSLYIVLLTRIKRVAERTSDQFSKLIVIGVLSWISLQAIINIGAMLGLLPLKGITLPFVSYGGTSLIFMTAALGLVFQVSRYTNFSTVEPIGSRHDKISFNTSRDGRRLGRAYNPNLVSRPRA